MSESKAPRRPGGRRPLPPLIFLVILAILALAVWWRVIRSDEQQTAASAAACTLTASPEQIAELNNMGSIQVHVLNGSDTQGLAAQVQTDLAARGITVLDIGNAGGDGQTGAGKIEYGPKDEFKARVLQANLSNFDIERVDTRTDGTLNVIIGQEYVGLAEAGAATTEVQALVEAQGKIVAGCPSPSTAN